MWFLKALMGFLTGPLSSISKDLTNAYEAKLRSQNDKERLEADERIAVLEARRDSILAAQSDPYERFIRIGFAVPVIVYFWKLMIWDKVLGLGVTDNLSPELWDISMIVLGGYFINTAIRMIKR